MPIRWIDAGRVSNYRSQSIYHGLGYAQSAETPDTVVMVIPENPYICIGYFQDAAREVDLVFCRDNQLPVIRRETGGGAVYIDSGQMFVQWVFQPGILPRKVEHRFQLFNKAMVETYRFFDIQANHFPINDVHVDGKKIVGTGAATIGHADVVTGNFLFDFDTEIMTQALNLPHSEFRQVIKSSLDNYMTWIGKELKEPPSLDEVKRVYKSKCEQALGMEMVDGAFTTTELDAIRQAETKLKSEEWLHSVKSSPSENKLVKIHAGVWIGWTVFRAADFSVRILSRVRNNRLEMVRFYLPDTFNPAWDMKRLEENLTTAALEDDEIQKRLKGFFSHSERADTLMSIEEWTEAVMQVKRDVQKASGHA